MAEKRPITPIAISVQTKKKCPLELAILLARPTPFPFMWMYGTTKEKRDPRSMMMYPDEKQKHEKYPILETLITPLHRVLSCLTTEWLG
jgi:hypothetical protein